MLFVLNKQERVIATLNNGGQSINDTPYFNDDWEIDLVSGAETYKFSTVLNKVSSEFLVVGNYIAFQFEDDYKLFQILTVDQAHGDIATVDIYCEIAGLSLINSVFRKNNLVSHDIKRFLDAVLLETEWNTGYIDMALGNVLDLELETGSVYSTLQNNIGAYGAEISFRCEITNNRISRKYVDAYFKRGKYTGRRFEFGRNVNNLKRNIDSSELFTALIGEGSNGLSFADIALPELNKPAGQDFVFDQESYNRYNHNGYHLMGVFKMETESPEELCRATFKKLQDCKVPKITYEVDVAMLNDLVSIGDTVNIVDHFFNPPLLLQARVSHLTLSLTDPQKDKCTLSNFIEVKSNINGDLMTEIKDFVNNTVSGQFPIGSDQIQDGAVNGDKIFESSITTDKLHADSITADKIQANSIKTKHLEAGTITADKIETGTITAESGVIGSLTADVITTGTLNGALVNVTNIVADNITSGVIDAEHINVVNVNATNITTGTLDAKLVNVTNLNAGNITAGVIDASQIQVINLDATNITSGSINADIIEGLIITGDMITAGTINANLAEIINLKAQNITSGFLSADRIQVGSLNADKITGGTITGDLISGNTITAGNIQTGTITAESGVIGSLNADIITAGTIDASVIGVTNLNASNITSGTIDASKVTVSNINAGNITGGVIDASKVTVSNLNADNITSGTINGTLINVTNLNASSITSGILDTSKINVSSTSGNLKIFDNTIQIKDSQATPVTRVQIGEDAQGDYNMYVYSPSGVLMFDAVYGVTSDGISNNAVGGDKIKDESITSNKLVIDEIFANQGFIGELQAVELRAEQITTGKINGEHIDITGVVEFNSLNKDMQENFIFDTTGDKTFINGGQLYTNTVTAEKINAKGLTVLDDTNKTTFHIDSKGEVFVTGTMQSSNFSENGNVGYKISKDGNIVMNNAIVRGDVLLPNAGITDFGGSKGNKNLLKKSNIWNTNVGTANGVTITFEEANSVLKAVTTADNGNWVSLSLSQSGIEDSFEEGDMVTVSFDMKSTQSGRPTFYVKSGMGYDAPTSTERLTQEYIRVYYTMTWKKANHIAFHFGFSGMAGTWWIKSCKIEKGDKATPYCLNEDELPKAVRFWAGSSFENRHNAPFKVLQDGSFETTKGTLGGTFTGELHIGNVHISDTNSSSALFEIKTNNNTETKVQFTDASAVLDVPVIFGSNSNRVMEIDQSNKTVKLNQSRLVLNHNSGYTGFNADGIIEFRAGEYSHNIKRESSNMIFENVGKTGQSDFTFKNNDGNVKVDVKGELNVDNIIRLGEMKIAKRTGSNGGIDFIL